MLQSMGLQRVGHELITEQQQSTAWCHTEACTCACSGGHLDRVCIFRRGFEQRGIQHRIGAKVNSVQASVDRSQEGQHYHPISNARGTSVQSLSHVRLFATPWTAARQASLPITNARSLLKLMSAESVMPTSRLILSYHLLLLPSIFPSITVFSSESALHIRWPKYWSFNFSISPSNE